MPIDNITEQADPRVPANTWEQSSLGPRELPSYQNVEATPPPPATSSSEEMPLGMRLALGLEGFGAGLTGQEPLYLKLRRQRMLEGQHQQELSLKLLQMKQQQTEQANSQFFRGAEMLKDNPKALKQLIDEEAGKGVPAASLFKRVGVTNKDIDMLTSPDFLTDLSTLSPTFHAKVTEALKSGQVDQVDPNEAQYWRKAIVERKDARFKAQQESREYSELKAKVADGTLAPDSPEADRFAELHSKVMKQRADLEKARIEIRAMGNPNKGTADLAAGVKTPEAITTQAGAEQAGRLPYTAGTEFQNSIAMALYDKPFGQLDQSQRQKVLDKQLAWEKEITGIRTAAQAQAKLDVPLGIESSSYARLTPDGKIQKGTEVPGLTPRQAQLFGFTNITKYDPEMKQIENAPSAIQIIDRLRGYAKELITAKPGLKNRLTQAASLTLDEIKQDGTPTSILSQDGSRYLTRGEVAALYQSVANANADLLTRAGGGQVGVATEKDTTRSLMNLATKYDTKQVMEEKFGQFRSLFQKRYERNLEVVFGKKSQENAVKDVYKRVYGEKK